MDALPSKKSILLNRLKEDIKKYKSGKLNCFLTTKEYTTEFKIDRQYFYLCLKSLTQEEQDIIMQKKGHFTSLHNSKKNELLNTIQTDIENHRKGQIENLPTLTEYAKLFQMKLPNVSAYLKEIPSEYQDYLKIQREKEKGRIKHYDNYGAVAKLRTNSGLEVQSFGEKKICDFLYSKGIGFEYDKQMTFEHTEKNEQGYTKSWERPDFWLTEYNIIIEYWGLKGQMDYDKKMEWKKRVYAESKTKYISIEPKDLNDLEEILTNKLKRLGITV